MEKEWLTILEVSKIIGVPENTARRYAHLFSEYVNTKQYGRALKYDRESIEILQKIAQLYRDGMSTDEIRERLRGAYAITVEVEPEEEHHAPVALAEIRKTINDMATYIQKQEEVNKQLMDKLDKQQELMEQSIKDRDEKLMAALKIMLEAKQEAAAGKWWKFGRK